MNSKELERIKVQGPTTFAEAQLVHGEFIRYAQAALVEGNAHAILRYLGELHDWGRQLVAARLYFREEELSRLGRVPTPFQVLKDTMGLPPLAVVEDRSMEQLNVDGDLKCSVSHSRCRSGELIDWFTIHRFGNSEVEFSFCPRHALASEALVAIGLDAERIVALLRDTENGIA